MISNVANLAVISSKCIEGYLFPELARQSYRWSFSFLLFLVEIILCIPLFFYIKKIYKPAVEQKSSGMEWHYLWIIPCTFYLMWNYTIYGNANRSSLESAIRSGNVAFLFFISAGAFLIYSVVSKLVLEQQKIIELQTRNHQLSTQTLQYKKLQDKITEARRAKHDVRHHITLMKKYLEDKDYDALNEYLNNYQKSIPDEHIFSVKILPSMQFFHIFPSRHVHLGSLTLFPLRFQNIFLFQRQIYPFYLEIFWKML